MPSIRQEFDSPLAHLPRINWRRAIINEGRGTVYEARDGRYVEIYYTTGGMWAADLNHRFGCTRVAYHRSREQVVNKLKLYTDFPENLERPKLDFYYLDE